MISQEEKTATADRLTDALAAAAAIIPPDGAHAFSSPGPGRLAGPASRPVRRRMGRLRVWLVPIVAAAGVTAIILTRRSSGSARRSINCRASSLSTKPVTLEASQ